MSKFMCAHFVLKTSGDFPLKNAAWCFPADYLYSNDPSVCVAK